jgi:hypothetical protein
MDRITCSLIGLAMGVVLALVIYSTDSTERAKTDLWKTKVMLIERCEKSLPRDKHCVLIMKTVIKGGG